MPAKIAISATVYVGRPRKMPAAQERQLHVSIVTGLRDGLLSIGNATKVVFLATKSKPEPVTTGMFAASKFKSEPVTRYVDYSVFVCPEPMAGRPDRYNTFALERGTGQIIVLGRELPYAQALGIALGKRKRKR